MLRHRLLAALFTVAPAFVHAEAPPLALRGMGSFHIGGREAVVAGKPVREVLLVPGGVPARIDPNGTYQVEAMYVQYHLPATPRGAVPLLLWHGGGLTGVTWESTPDGREGWQQFFLRRGWDTYVSDAVERGRSGWAMTPEIFQGDPIFLTKGDPWERFRIGAGPGSYRTRTALPGIESVFGLAARQADVANGARGRFRAGERKTDWTEPRTARLSYGRWMRLSAFPRRDVSARGHRMARWHGRMGRGLAKDDGWRMVRALAGGSERPPRWPSDSRARPLCDAGRVRRPGLGNCGAHEVSHIQRRLPACTRTSMTTMVPWRQTGQSVNDVPVRDKCSAR